MKRILLTILALQAAVFAGAQQDVQFSQNRFLNTSVNPGAVGIRGVDCFGLTLRQQWIGFEGRPTTGMLTYEKALPQYNMGVGGVLVFDQIGLESSVFFKANGAYHLTLSNGAKLGLGLDIGIINKQISGDFIAGVMTDPDLAPLLGGSQSSINVDLGVGAFYYTPELYFGISGQKLIPQKVAWGSVQPQIRPHTYFVGGYNYVLPNPDFTLKPSFLVKTDFTATQVDVNLIVDYKTKVWAGASYRIQDAIVFMAGYSIENVLPNPLKIGLAYDFTTQNLAKPGDFEYPIDAQGNVQPTKQNNRSYGAVELNIRYCFIAPVKPPYGEYIDPLFGNN